MKRYTRTFSGTLALVIVGSAIFGIRASAQSAATTIDSNAVMGFETPFAWTAKSSTSSMIMVSATTKRTQGSFAYAVTNPGNLVTMTSAPVASTAKALVGVGNPGALFQVDVFLPTVVGNVNNTGQIQMFVNSPSRGLSKVFVGDVLFSSFRPGTYNTLKFPIPSAVGTALGAASFTDLTFIFLVSSPGQVTGPYLFDNLRVHSVRLVQAGLNTQPPPGYGGSVDFVVFGGTPVAQTFNVGVIQVPEGFHLKLGTTGSTTVQLQLGYDGTPSFTCTYGPDSADASGKSYILTSCTGGMQAGDLVGADWANLSIVGGDATQKIRAQLAENPVGDTAGTGIIPAMPTFWGDFGGCIPAVVANHVKPPFTSPSASCADQIGQASQIVTSYVNKLNSSSAAPNWIVTPKPEFARRHGDGSPHNNLTGPPPPPNDPDFDQEGHVDEGGDWDAYFRLNGSLDTVSSDPSSTPFHNTTHFDATLSGHVVLYGQDVNVVSIETLVDSDTGMVDPTGFSNPTVTGSLHEFVFGVETPGGGSAVPSVGFNFNLGATAETDTGDVQIWIFVVNLGATATVGVDTTGTLSPIGFNLQIMPQVTMGVHASGSVGISGIASGGIDVRDDSLLTVKVPMSAVAAWFLTTDPTQCDAKLGFSGEGNAQISSDGPDINLVATFGDCPFCKDFSWNILSWGPIVEYSRLLFGPVTATQTLFPLPISLCKVQLTNVSITSPGPTANASLKYMLTGTASRPPTASTGDASSGVPNIIPDTGVSFFDCSSSNPAWSFQWSLSPDLGELTGQDCNASVTFQAPAQGTTSTRTLTLTATYTTTDASNRTITESKSTSETITVAPLTPGPHINTVACVPASSSCSFDVSNSTTGQVPILTINSTNTIDALQLTGIVAGATGSTTVTWTAATTPGGTPVPIGTGTAITWNNGGAGFTASQTTYNITMSATSGGSSFGTPSTVQVQFVALK